MTMIQNDPELRRIEMQLKRKEDERKEDQRELDRLNAKASELDRDIMKVQAKLNADAQEIARLEASKHDRMTQVQKEAEKEARAK